MAQVDFYILQNETPGGRERLACQVTDRAWQAGQQQIYLQAASPQQAQQLNEMLWTFKDLSFLAHALYPQQADSIAPIFIGCGEQAHPAFSGTLINLTAEVPPFYSQFSRIAEILNLQPDIRAAGRERYRFYRDQGYSPLNSHDIFR